MKEIFKKIQSLNLRIKLAGDNGFHLIPINDCEIEKNIQLIYNQIKHAKPLGVLDVIPSLVNLLIVFDKSLTYFEKLVNEIIEILKSKSSEQNNENYLWEIPICYDNEFAQDIKEVSDICKLKPEEVCKLHLERVYNVKMMGFLPGLPFMGDLNDKLFLPRKSEPRLRVPSGSVGIAMNQTVIYPQESPGGWNLIGRIPINIFEIRKEKSILFTVGDKVKFNKISIKKFYKIYENNLKSPCEISNKKIM